MSPKKKNRLTKIQKSIQEVLAQEEDRDIEVEHGDETNARLGRNSDDEEDQDHEDFEGRDQGFDFAQERSALRTKNVRPLEETDPKYQGVKKTRKQMQKERGEETLDEKEQKTAEWADLLMMNDEEEEVDQDSGGDEEEEEEEEENGSEEQEQEDDEEPLNNFKNESHDFGQYGSVSDEEEDVDDESEGEENEEEAEGEAEGSDANEDASLPIGIQIVTKGSNVQAEIEKGLAIKKQLALSDSLLETRIQMQKILGKVNQFPQPDTWNEFKTEGDETYKKAVKKSQVGLKKLLDGLLELKTLMVNGNPELKRSFCQSHSDQEESEEGDDSNSVMDLEPCPKKMKLSEYSSLLEDRHKALIPFRDETIEKWNDKTRLATGVVNKKSFSGFETSTLKQIEHILTDKSRLIKRTQNKRSSYRILGQSELDATSEESFDPEIFDDDDFYHQLLRELIDRKTADVTDPLLLGKQWPQIQKMRSKMKKKVDTKASKGRKTRYDIHAKLVNFMAPIYTESWKDETKNELFSSLFGKC